MIGIFDSGAGGLSVYREIIKILPDEKYIYFSDNAHCPYGEKTREYIIDRARSITDYLISRGCSIIVVACNTATAAAVATLREEYDIPFIGMEPAVKPAALSTKTGVIGVLATAGTLGAEKYHNTKEKFASNVTVVEHVGKGFVELVEGGDMSSAEAEQTVRASVEPLLAEGADVIVLGCTHYPFLSPLISKVCEGRATIIDPAPAVARQLKKIAKEHELLRNDGPYFEALSSGDDSTLKNLISHL